MAPIATADLIDVQYHEESAVLPSRNADSRLRSLWYEHGDPWDLNGFANPTLTTLTSLLGYNATKRPNEVGFLCPEGEAFVKITWRNFDRTVASLAVQYSQAFRFQIDEANRTLKQPTIALLGSGHTYAYFATQLALLKLGLRVLLLSPSNASIARDHLLATCDAVGLVYQQESQSDLQDVDLATLSMLPVSLDPPCGNHVEDVVAFESSNPWNSQSFIIHSSGTTGLPKPIIHTHRSLMLIARMYRLFPAFAINNWYLAFPLFHIAGVSIALSGLPNGLALTFPSVNWPPAPSSILSAWRQLEQVGHPAECLHCAPAVIEDLYEYLGDTSGDFSPLVKLKVLQPGGAALSPLLLKKLVAVGCNVKTTYGSTEIGPPWRTTPHTRDNPSCYRVRNLYPDSPHLEMQALGEGLFEPVIHKGFPLAAELWPSKDSPNPYRTNDLFIEDPPGSGLFVLQGRKDDLLVHSNGEKTNALALQMALDSSPQIQKSAVIGTGRPCPAVVIQPSNARVSSADIVVLLEAIEDICLSFPTYSRISRSMVYILNGGRKLPVTPKGSVRRKEVEKLYGQDIDAMYAKLENGEDADSAQPAHPDLPDEAFILDCVQRVLGSSKAVTSDASFYRLGLDSQGALRLRSALMKRFGKFPLHAIFEHPSVTQLAHTLADPERELAPTARHHQWMQAAIRGYAAEIQTWPKLPAITSPASNGEVVYLTGATGALGNALLEAFATNPAVRKVYCAIRGNRKRLASGLLDRGYSCDVAESTKIEVVPFAMSEPLLGLDETKYARMTSEVTIVLHNAWNMDFNTPVNEFEHDCLRGAMHVMKFANTGRRKTFAFSSSVATHLGPAAAGRVIPEDEAAEDVSLALDTGYAQSKYIVDRVLQSFSRQTGLPVKIFRIGQLCGHSSSGAWNESEMFPIMLATGLKHLHTMPLLDGEQVDWLPVELCAQSISELLTQRDAEQHAAVGAKCAVHNLVNPHPIAWDRFLDALEQASGVPFARIGMAEWVSRLQDASGDDQIPGGRLIGFFEDMAKQGAAQPPTFSTAKTQQLASALASARGMNVELLRVYVDRWRASGFM